MRKIIWMVALAVCALMPQVVNAVPAYPGKKTMIRKDGTQITLQLVGDEFFHFFRSDEGDAYRLLDNGTFESITDSELQKARNMAAAKRNTAAARRARKRVGEFVEGGITGDKKGLVILINFRDKEFVTSEPHAVYTDFFNKSGYDYEGMAGSVADYFAAQSYGKLNVDFDVVGPYTLSKPMGYYGGNDANGNDSHVQNMAEEACRLANPDVNFADYDWNEDGVVDQVFLIYAGYGENYGAESSTVWPHAYTLPEGLELDYMKFNNYACTCELMGKSGTRLAGIGTACHEFSHCLGLPDTYDTSGGGAPGMSSWDVMDHGSYNGGGYTPAGYTAYERWVSGWLTPVEVTEYTEVKDMKPLTQEGEAYILYNEGNCDEYYILENRQQIGFDAALPGHGLMVMHIDYDRTAWTSNGPNNNPSHQRITYVPADGVRRNADSGDPFPGKKQVHNLTDFSVPVASVYNPNVDGEKLMHKSIENITETDEGLISFSVMKPELAIPVPTITRTEDKVMLNWEAVEGADAYELRYTETKAQGSLEEACLYAEDFQGAYRASAGFKDIGAELNKYLSTSGFSGENLFQSPDLLRLGSSSKQGKLYSPTITNLSTGKLTFVFTLKPFKEGDETKVNFSIYTNAGTQETFNLTFTEKKTFVIQSEKMYAEALRTQLVAEQRCYISYMAAYDGIFDIPVDQTRGIGQTRAGIKEVTLRVEGTSFVIEPAAPASTFRIELRSFDGLRYSRWGDVIEVAPSGNTIPLLPQDNPSVLNRWFDLNGKALSEPNRPGIYIYIMVRRW